jgi:hypothetical protein
VLGYLRDEEEWTMATQQQLDVSRATDEGRAIATLTIALAAIPSRAECFATPISI